MSERNKKLLISVKLELFSSVKKNKCTLKIIKEMKKVNREDGTAYLNLDSFCWPFFFSCLTGVWCALSFHNESILGSFTRKRPLQIKIDSFKNTSRTCLHDFKVSLIKKAICAFNAFSCCSNTWKVH